MRPLPDAELAANAAQVAGEILRHQATLIMAPAAVDRLAEIAGRHPAIVSDLERRLLRLALQLVDAVEMGQEVAHQT